MLKFAEKSENLKKLTKCDGAGAARPTSHLVKPLKGVFLRKEMKEEINMNRLLPHMFSQYSIPSCQKKAKTILKYLAK